MPDLNLYLFEAKGTVRVGTCYQDSQLSPLSTFLEEFLPEKIANIKQIRIFEGFSCDGHVMQIFRWLSDRGRLFGSLVKFFNFSNFVAKNGATTTANFLSLFEEHHQKQQQQLWGLVLYNAPIDVLTDLKCIRACRRVAIYGLEVVILQIHRLITNLIKKQKAWS